VIQYEVTRKIYSDDKIMGGEGVPANSFWW